MGRKVYIVVRQSVGSEYRMLYIVSADYDYSLNSIVLKLYNTDTGKLEYYYDTEFKPYFYAREKQNFEGIIKQELVERYDALHDEHIKVWKVTVKGPDVISKLNKKLNEWENQNIEVWENHIKFYMRYIYDNDIKMGMPYMRESGMLLLCADEKAKTRIEEIINLVKPETYNKVICEQLANLLEFPAPELKRVSLDIEVLGEEKKIPSPSSANLPVICVCMISNTGEKRAFILIQEDKPFTCPEADSIEWFSDEAELLEEVFKFGSQYPFVITFNGDDFDLPYLMNRAIRLGIPIDEIPITHNAREKIAYWKDAIHIDLYKFFSIKSMQNYAFQQKYKDVTLDAVSKALIQEGKMKGEHEWVNDMSYEELLTYCINDAHLTIKLTTYSDNVVMNLMLVLARLSYMPIEQVSRKPISQWIRSFIYYEHRKRNTIIPRTEDIKAMKGETITTALIKGKKYKGAIVVDPVAGYHFNVKVGDFASLYPSIIKNWNLGYSTVNCSHLNDWDLIDGKTKRLIYWICYIIMHSKEVDIKCPAEELEKLMKNIEKETRTTQETIVNETEKELISYKEILMKETKSNQSSKLSEKNKANDIWKLIEKNIMIIINGGKENYENEQNQTQTLTENLKIVETAQFEDNYKGNDKNSIIQKEINVKNVEILTIDALKSIIWTEERSGETAVNLLKRIGTDYNFFVQTVTKLNILERQSCKNNTFAGMKHWICLKNRAIESQIIGTLKDLRVKWYKKMAKDKNNPLKPWYSVAEQSIKVICNASYGVFGDEKFVLYCPPMPEYVTGIGRWIITQTIQHAQELKLNVLAGDTDSVFFKDPPQEVLEELLAWAEKEFGITFELDKEYRYVCLSDRKKNYLGVLKDGTVDVKGLTGKKKHTPQIIKTPFEETKKLLAQVYNESDIQIAKKGILKLVKTTYTKLKTRNFGNMEDLAFHVTASKDIEDYDSDPQHIKAAKLLQKAGYDIGEGSDISFVKTTDKLKVKPTQLAKPNEIDVSKYTEYLKSTFIQILEPLGIDWDKEILGICVMDRFCPKES